MISEKFNFSLPTQEEVETVKWLAENSPEELDGRDLWIWKNFLESGFE